LSQIYLWQFNSTSQESAAAQFNDMLEKLTAFYNTNLTSNCEFRSIAIGNIIVGQISNNLGILKWNPWMQEGSNGCAWAGVCEDYLGISNTTLWLNNLANDVIDHPKRLAELTGSFSICAWNSHKKHVAIATGATQHQTLWLAKGPKGWAIGSRARIALLLSGYRLEMNSNEVSLFLSYGYHLGQESLFKNIKRIKGRKHILFRQHEPPQQKTYIALSDYIGKPEAKNFNDAVDICVHQLKKRVKKQVYFSRDPLLTLTGGRDSRCIAAALYNTDFNSNVVSYNLVNNIDSKIALKISKMLYFQHNTIDIDQLYLLSKYRSRAQLFIKSSEGIETIRHNLINKEFFDDENYKYEPLKPVFIGLHAGLRKPITNSYTFLKLNNGIERFLKIDNDIPYQCLEIKKNIDVELESLDVSNSRWPELFYWQHKALKWGQDNMSAKDLYKWWWTPLFDRILIQISWHLPEQYHASMRFIEAITVRLAPQLKHLKYDRPIYSSKFINFFYKNICNHYKKINIFSNKSLIRHSEIKNNKIIMWYDILFKNQDCTWKDWIDENYILNIIKTSPDSEILWNVITVQLFKEAFFPE